MSKNYEVLNELVPKTQELHRAIFDKGYEQGRLQVIDEIRTEIADLADTDAYGDYQQGFNFGLMRAAQIIDKYKSESEDKE